MIASSCTRTSALPLQFSEGPPPGYYSSSSNSAKSSCSAVDAGFRALMIVALPGLNWSRQSYLNTTLQCNDASLPQTQV